MYKLTGTCTAAIAATRSPKGCATNAAANSKRTACATLVVSPQLGHGNSGEFQEHTGWKTKLLVSANAGWVGCQPSRYAKHGGRSSHHQE